MIKKDISYQYASWDKVLQYSGLDALTKKAVIAYHMSKNADEPRVPTKEKKMKN